MHAVTAATKTTRDPGVHPKCLLSIWFGLLFFFFIAQDYLGKFDLAHTQIRSQRNFLER